MTATKSLLSDKFIYKWMRQARQIALDNNTPCSRKVGAIIVDPDNIVRGIGYNGAPRNTPNCDSWEYIQHVLIPKLDQEDRDKLATKAYFGEPTKYESFLEFTVPSRLDGCGQCPRRILGYKPGERTDLCSCQHAERNTITNCNGPVNGCILLGWCCVSCFQCTGAIINARIKEVHFLEGPEYESGCLKLYEFAKIPVFLHSEGEFS